jgi:hypothetical protein
LFRPANREALPTGKTVAYQDRCFLLMNLPDIKVVCLAGVVHFISLSEIIHAPIPLGCRETLGRVSQVLRQMGQVYHYDTMWTIMAMRSVSLFCAPGLTAATPLARAGCAYSALLRTVRLGGQIYSDFRPHVDQLWCKIGYRALNILFVSFGILDVWLAIRA